MTPREGAFPASVAASTVSVAASVAEATVGADPSPLPPSASGTSLHDTVETSSPRTFIALIERADSQSATQSDADASQALTRCQSWGSSFSTQKRAS